MLVGQDQKEQLFRSYETLAARCSQLVQDQRVLEAQLAAPMSQLPALETFTEELYRLLYNSSNELQLSSPVSKHSCCTGPCWVARGWEPEPPVPSALGAGAELTASQPTEGEEVGLILALSQKSSSEALAG